jgi:hypothetical protein
MAGRSLGTLDIIAPITGRRVLIEPNSDIAVTTIAARIAQPDPGCPEAIDIYCISYKGAAPFCNEGGRFICSNQLPAAPGENTRSGWPSESKPHTTEMSFRSESVGRGQVVAGRPHRAYDRTLKYINYYIHLNNTITMQ